MTIDEIAREAARKEVRAALRHAPEVRWGTVTSTVPLEVELAGDDGVSTPIGLKLDGYSPALNDTVRLERVGVRWVVTGKVVPS